MSEANDKEMSEIQDKEEVGQDMSEAREDVVVETKIVQDDETQVGEEATVAREDDGGEEAEEEAEEEKVGSEGTEAENEGGEPEMEGGEPEKEGGEPEREEGEPEKEGDGPEKEGGEPEKEWGEPEREETPPPSENPSESIEVGEKDPQVPSEAVASEPTAAVEPPPEPCLTNQTSQIEEKSQDKNDNDEEQIAVDEPENATASEENMDTDIKEENMDTCIKEENTDTDVKEENMDTDIKEENGNETVQRDGIIDADIMQSKENFAQAVPFKQDNTREETQVNAIRSFSFDAHVGDGDESGTEEEQAAFMRELENFFRERNLEFKPPKFYGEGLNCLKLWRAVTRLGGYDQVTSCKLWRQVGESFNPPKTCTTVSWSFRCFYEKALLEYERHKVRGGELRVTPSPLSDPVGVDNQVGGSQASGSGRARRDAAARAMQGWHSQRLLGNGEVGDPIIKDKTSVALPKREKQIKSLSLLKRKKPSTLERAVKVARSKGANPRDVQGSQAVRMDTMVADIGPAADWVKINVRRTKDCYEVYALVPGLLREEVRVQSDASGRLVISGDPEQPDNPWGVTPFKKVISLPSRIDAHQTSAVVTLHGQLFVRAPFEPSDL